MKHRYFWLTLFGILYTVGIFVFIVVCAIYKRIIFEKIYCLLLLPLFIYLLIQTTFNYCELTEQE